MEIILYIVMDLSGEIYKEIEESYKLFLKSDDKYFYNVYWKGNVLKPYFDRAVRELIFTQGKDYTMRETLKIDDVEFVDLGNSNRIKNLWLKNTMDDLKTYDIDEVSKVDIDKHGIQAVLTRKEDKNSPWKHSEGDKHTFDHYNTYRIKLSKGLHACISLVRSGEGVSFRNADILKNGKISYKIHFEIENPEFIKNEKVPEPEEPQRTIVEEEETEIAEGTEGPKGTDGEEGAKGTDGEEENGGDEEGNEGEEEDQEGGGANEDLERIWGQIVEVLSLFQGNYLLEDLEVFEAVKEAFAKSMKGSNPFIIASHLERKHLLENSGNSVLSDYAYALYPKGEPVALYIHESKDKRYDGTVFLIDQGFNIYSTHYSSVKHSGTVLKAVYILEQDRLVLEDVFKVDGKDVRDLPLNTKTGTGKKARIHILKGLCKELEMESIEYKASVKKTFFENAKDLWEAKGLQNYPVEGIVFTPIKDSYPQKEYIWNKQFIWREKDYINVIVKSEKDEDGTPIVFPKVDTTYNTIEQHKSYNIFVRTIDGQYNNSKGGWETVFDDIRFLEGDKSKIGVKVDSRSQRNYIENAFTNIVQMVKDDIVVEARWTAEGWEILGVDEKLSEFYRLEEPLPFAIQKQAENGWEAMNHPITFEILSTGVIPEPTLEGGGIVSQFQMLETNYPYTNFHRYVVNRMLLTDNGKAESKEYITGELIDFSSGKGEELINWIHAKYATVMAIEINKMGVDYAKEYYKRYTSTKPVCHFIWADMSQLIFPRQRAGLNKLAKLSLQEYMPSKWTFDMCSLGYLVPYFFESELKLRALLQNANDVLKVGGLLVGTALDGQKVFNLLGDSKREGWIKRVYSETKYPRKLPNYGMKILVDREDVNSYEEYLVNFFYLNKIMREYGFEEVRIDSFEYYYGFVEQMPLEIRDIVQMNDEEKAFSFLNNAFVYRKVKNSSERLYRKLANSLN